MDTDKSLDCVEVSVSYVKAAINRAVILIVGAAFGMTMEQLDKDDKNK